MHSCSMWQCNECTHLAFLSRVILALGFRFLLLSVVGGGGEGVEFIALLWGERVEFIALFVFYNKDNKKLILFIYI